MGNLPAIFKLDGNDQFMADKTYIIKISNLIQSATSILIPQL